MPWHISRPIPAPQGLTGLPREEVEAYAQSARKLSSAIGTAVTAFTKYKDALKSAVDITMRVKPGIGTDTESDRYIANIELSTYRSELFKVLAQLPEQIKAWSETTMKVGGEHAYYTFPKSHKEKIALAAAREKFENDTGMERSDYGDVTRLGYHITSEFLPFLSKGGLTDRVTPEEAEGLWKYDTVLQSMLMELGNASKVMEKHTGALDKMAPPQVSSRN